MILQAKSRYAFLLNKINGYSSVLFNVFDLSIWLSKPLFSTFLCYVARLNLCNIIVEQLPPTPTPKYFSGFYAMIKPIIISTYINPQNLALQQLAKGVPAIYGRYIDITISAMIPHKSGRFSRYNNSPNRSFSHLMFVLAHEE